MSMTLRYRGEPLFFLDYIGTGRLQPRFYRIDQRICASVRSEPLRSHWRRNGANAGVLPEGEYDLSGTIVGVVEKSRLLDGRRIRRGDAVIGLASSGLHTNGYSLARKIFFGKMKLKPRTFIPELRNTIGNELLKVHVSYGPLVRKLLQKGSLVKGLAHITGGGFTDNIPRVLPKKCDVVIHKGSWEIPPIFQLIEGRGGVEEYGLYQVFNMGIGMTVIVAADQADTTLKFIRAQKQPAWLIGEVVPGAGHARVV